MRLCYDEQFFSNKTLSRPLEFCGIPTDSQNQQSNIRQNVLCNSSLLLNVHLSVHWPTCFDRLMHEFHKSQLPSGNLSLEMTVKNAVKLNPYETISY